MDRKMVVTPYQQEDLAAAMLEDPEVRRLYEAALKEEPGMRADTARRLWWFYRRSPYFDEQVGLYPVLRATTEPGVATAGWAPESAAGESR